MDKAYNYRGPVFGPVCIVHFNRGAPPGVIEPDWFKPPRGTVLMYDQEKQSWFCRYLVTHRPRESAARGRPPSHWRRIPPGKPAFGPVQGEVHPVVNEKYQFQLTDYQLIKNANLQILFPSESRVYTCYING